MGVDEFGDYVLLTNFKGYVDTFARRFDCEVKGVDRPMQAASNDEGLTIVNFGIGTANAATIMDLLTARMPQGVLFLGKCGGLKESTEIGHFILPIAAIRGAKSTRRTGPHRKTHTSDRAGSNATRRSRRAASPPDC